MFAPISVGEVTLLGGDSVWGVLNYRILTKDEKINQELPDSLGETIKAHRKRMKMTQSQLAENTLLSTDTISRIEKGEIYTRATVVDHIRPHKGNRELFWDRTNWQSLCKQCHDRKTLTEDMGGRMSKVYEYPT